MKKTIIKILCLSFLLSVFFVPVNAHESDKSEVEKFEEIQNKITESLTIEGNHYKYDLETVNALINQVDVIALNEEVGTDYTMDSLRAAILYKLNTYVIPEQTPQTRGAYCNRTEEFKRWNYNRYYTSEGNTESWIAQLRSDADADSIASFVTSILGFTDPFMGVTSVLLSAKSIWRSRFANALDAKNGTCGLVTDINSFTSEFTVNKQIDWWTYE